MLEVSLLFTALPRLWCAVFRLVRTVNAVVVASVKIVVACCCWAAVSDKIVVRKLTRCCTTVARWI